MNLQDELLDHGRSIIRNEIEREIAGYGENGVRLLERAKAKLAAVLGDEIAHSAQYTYMPGDELRSTKVDIEAEGLSLLFLNPDIEREENGQLCLIDAGDQESTTIRLSHRLDSYDDLAIVVASRNSGSWDDWRPYTPTFPGDSAESSFTQSVRFIVRQEIAKALADQERPSASS